MLYTILTLMIVFLAGFAYYIFYLKPRLDPSNKAQEMIKNRRYKDAVIEYKKILDNKPFDFVTHYRLANIYLKMNEEDQAAIHLQRVIEINQFNYEVDKLDVQKKLAKIANDRDDIEVAFGYYYEILKMYPADYDAMYNVAFITLGHEEFDIAQKYFDRLVKNKTNNFEIMFGAGICSFQNQKINEAVDMFKYAVGMRPESEIANLAMILALMKKKDFRSAMIYANKLLGIAEDIYVKYIAYRCVAFLELHLKRYDDSVRKFEELLEFVKKNELQEEINLVLYDIGFACVKAEYTKRAYEYWNEISGSVHGFRDIQELVIMLRRELENASMPVAGADSISDKIDDWIESPFPIDFLWGICGLKSNKTFPIRDYLVSTKVVADSDPEYADVGYMKDLVERFSSLDTENFRIIANRLVNTMGYKVEQIMPTYRESDGIDFLAIKKDTKEKAFVWVRRWKKTRVGEIPLRNFAQMVNDMKASVGLFITTTNLTDEAQGTVKNLSKVKVIQPEELNYFLQGLL
jgi:tetratricopeptide (TPR) repeat protein